ncbi:MAG: MOSC domain-containing protein [Actinomycetota bacterium]
MHRTTVELTAALPWITGVATDAGTVQLIVRRPAPDAREVLPTAQLDTHVGLVGDTWAARPSRLTADGGPHPGMQVTLMNSRLVEFIAGERERWPLAGDQFYVDLDLGVDNLPAGALVQIGQAVLEISDAPHNGCAKFTQRFGLDAMHFVNSADGKHHRLRGVNARVVVGGPVTTGDTVTVLVPPTGEADRARPPA